MTKKAVWLLAPVLLVSLSAGAAAQLGLPAVEQVVPAGPETLVGAALDPLRLDTLSASQLRQVLRTARGARLDAFVRANRAQIERDGDGNPVVRGELIALGITPAALAAAQEQGFVLREVEAIEGIDLVVARFWAPDNLRLPRALARLAAIPGAGEVSANPIYFSSGTAGSSALAGMGTLASGRVERPVVGMIDGGVAAHAALTGPIEQRGFAEGAPRPSAHGTEVASLIAGSGSVGSANPGAQLLVADVYGSEPAGGNALAIARGLGWLTARGVPVVTISLVGPDNPVLRAAVRAAQGKGVLVVAAVGNDGPAAPHSFPASLPGVIAVTGTDARFRVLPEAGRAAHVDFAAPGSGILAADIAGSTRAVRGTSFAAPLVAGRLARHYPRPEIGSIHQSVTALMREARDIGPRGADRTYGNGLICEDCVRR